MLSHCFAVARKLHRWSLKCNNPVFLKSTERKRDAPPTPMPRRLESVISMHVCSHASVCLCCVGWQGAERTNADFIEGHCGRERVAMIASGLAFDVIELLQQRTDDNLQV